MDEPQWLLWARELQAIAQTGLTFSEDSYDLSDTSDCAPSRCEMLAVGSNTPIERMQGLFDQDVGYPTPKVDVRGAVFRDDCILLVREISDGRWTLPEAGPTSIRSAETVRRARDQEESGYRGEGRSSWRACMGLSPAGPCRQPSLLHL